MGFDDKEIKNLIVKEYERQNTHIELIASENFVSQEVLDAQGSILTNKYAEGYPHKRYYGGCEVVDEIEALAIARCTKLFNCKYANVQPHSGSSANMASYRALLKPRDRILGMSLSSGGHLTHGMNLNFSGMDYECLNYGVNPETGLIDYDEVLKLTLEFKPKLIVAGASAYSRFIDFRKFREICDRVGALLMVDMAHIAGLVAVKLHPSPFPYADIVTSTTHKTLRGPRGGIILTNNEEIAKKVDKIIFPGIQGGPLMHVIAAKAICFYEALQPEFKVYPEQVLKNAKVLATNLELLGYKIISGGTDNHLLLVDIKSSCNLTGKEAESILDSVNITCNKNTIPNDQEKPFVTSGLRLGTAAMTTRGFKEKEMIKVAILIDAALKYRYDLNKLAEIKQEVINLCLEFPL